METPQEIKETSTVEQQNTVNTPTSQKLSEAEIKLLTDLNTNKETVNREVAFLAQQRLIIDYRQDEVEKLYRSNLETERQLGAQLTEKYGNGSIDIENGVFLPS